MPDTTGWSMRCFRGLAFVTLFQWPLVQSLKERLHRHLISGGFDVFDDDLFSYYTRIPQGDDNFCGGSLVAPDMVLTSAACQFENVSEVEVVVGWKAGAGEEASIASVFTHPDFNEATLDHAFALIQLRNVSSIDVVVLDNKNESTAGNISSSENITDLTILGSTINRLTPTLASAQVFPVSDAECEAKKNDGGFPLELGSSQYCAGDEIRGFCHDDWGSPLVLLSENATQDPHVQIGVAAWTFCGITGDRQGKSSPGVYLRVSDGYEWIKWTICSNSASPPSHFDCVNATAVVPQTAPTRSPVPSPIRFRYELINDGFLFEVGLVVEKIVDLRTVEIVHYITPGALLAFSLYAEASEYVAELDLETNALYAFSVMDGEADGIFAEFVQGIRLYLQNSNGIFEKVLGRSGGFAARETVLFYASTDFVPGSFFFRPTFEGEQYLYLEISFDGYPWEIGMELLTDDGTRIWFTPPRYYEVPDVTVREKISIPPIDATYVLSVSDTKGDGLGFGNDTWIRVLNREEEQLGSLLSFETGDLVSILIEYEIVTPTPTNVPTTSPTYFPSAPSMYPLSTSSASHIHVTASLSFILLLAVVRLIAS